MKIKPLLLIFVLLIGCGTIDVSKIVFSVKNPTEYTFNCSIDSLKTIIKKEFDNYQFYEFSLGYKERALVYSDIFKDSINKNDFVLEEFVELNKCVSKVYFRNSTEPYVYKAIFHLHLQNLAPNVIKISIKTINPELLKGLSRFPMPPHFNRGWVYFPIIPTTVEEYEILLIIGKALGVKDMPSLKIPDKIIIEPPFGGHL